jgi:hypothetical protein
MLAVSAGAGVESDPIHDVTGLRLVSAVVVRGRRLDLEHQRASG